MRRRTWLWLGGCTLGLALFVHYCVRFVPGDGGDAASSGAQAGKLSIPVENVRPDQLADTFTQSRSEGRGHDAIDIMAPRGTRVIAAAPGRVEKLFRSERGGNTVYVRSPDRHWIYYYAHLDSYRMGLAEGQVIRRGDTLGAVGSTGDADPSGPHLHFAINRMQPGESWYQGEPVNPYPLLTDRGR